MNNIPNPDDFWPEAKELLDKHYAAKKKKIIFWRWGIAFSAGVAILICSRFLVPSIYNTTIQGQLSSSLQENNQSQLTSDNLAQNGINYDGKEVATLNSQEHISSSLRGTKQTQTQSKSFSQRENNKEVFEVATQFSKRRNTNYETAALNTPSLNEKELADENVAENNTEVLTAALETNIFSKKQNKALQLLSLHNYVLENNNLDNTINLLILPVYNLKTTADDYAQDKSNLNISVGVYYGMQQVSKKLSGNSENIEYVARRTNEEHKTNKSFYGVNCTITKNKLQLQTGIEYNTIGEKINYQALSKQWQVSDLSKWNTYTKQVAVIDTVYHFGIKSYKTNYKTIADSSLLTQYDSIYTNTKNNKIAEANTKTKLSYIEIPLMIGYKFSKSKFEITPLVGISAGYIVIKSGMYLNKTLTDIERISDNKNIKNYMLNYCLQLQLSYNINHKFALYVVPQYKANAFSVTNKAFGVSTFYKTYGALLGVNYRL